MKDQNKLVFMLNTVLLSVATLFLLSYVIEANTIAIDNYKVKLANDNLVSLTELQSYLTSKKSTMEDTSKILDFAKSRNMIEAKNTTYLFENGNVALQK